MAFHTGCGRSRRSGGRSVHGAQGAVDRVVERFDQGPVDWRGGGVIIEVGGEFGQHALQQAGGRGVVAGEAGFAGGEGAVDEVDAGGDAAADQTADDLPDDRIVPLCAASTRLRPITASLRLEVTTGSPEHQAVEDFRRVGAPFDGIPGTVTEVSGPPGLDRATGPALFSFMTVTEPDEDRPDLEVRLVTTDGAVLHTLDLVDVELSRGNDGPGI